MSASPSSSDRNSPQPPTLVNPGAGSATQAVLYDQVFGDDLSDADSDNEERRPAQRVSPPLPPLTAQSPVPAPSANDRDDDDDDDDDEDMDRRNNDRDDDDEDRDEDKDEDDVYVPGSASAAAKIPKFKKKAKSADDDDLDEDRDDVDADEERRKKRKRKEKKEKRAVRDRAADPDVDVDEDVPEQNLTEHELRKMRLNERIDAIGKKPKAQRRKKKGDDDVDIVDTYHDEICGRLRERMIQAAEKDRASNDQKRPATAKLAMLEEVMGILRNTTLWQSIVDNGVLEAVRNWLEPISPSGALPAVGIQKAIFEILPKMDLDTQTLKESRLGPIMLFYTKTRRVTPDINRQADALVQAWSRPIIKRPANLRNRHVETLSEAVESAQGQRSRDEDGDVEEPVAPRPMVKKKRFDVVSATQDNKGKKGARLFNARDVQYTVAPESQLQHRNEDINHVSRIQMDNKKFNKFARQMKARTAR